MLQRNEAPAQGRHAFAALILANIFLALGPWMVRLADVGPVASAFWRVMIAAPLLLLVVRVAEKQRIWPGAGLALVIIVGGLFFAADLAAWHYGILRTKLANATLFGNSASFILPLYGFIAARSLPRRSQAVALLFAGAGAILLLGRSYELSPEHLTGDLFTILAGLFYAFYLIAIDRARKTLAPMAVLALSTVASTVPLILFSLLLGEKIMPGNWTPLILLSLGSQVIGQGLLVYSIGYINPVVVAVALLTQPIVTAIIGWVAYDERLAVADGAGAALICIAMILIRLPARVETASAHAHLEERSERR